MVSYLWAEASQMSQCVSFRGALPRGAELWIYTVLLGEVMLNSIKSVESHTCYNKDRTCANY